MTALAALTIIGMRMAVPYDRANVEGDPVMATPMPRSRQVDVASAANMANLLDLRPGRALKVTVVASAVVLAAAGRPGGDRRRNNGCALFGRLNRLY